MLSTWTAGVQYVFRMHQHMLFRVMCPWTLQILQYFYVPVEVLCGNYFSCQDILTSHGRFLSTWTAGVLDIFSSAHLELWKYGNITGTIKQCSSLCCKFIQFTRYIEIPCKLFSIRTAGLREVFFIYDKRCLSELCALEFSNYWSFPI